MAKITQNTVTEHLERLVDKDYKINTEMKREKEKKAFGNHAYSFVHGRRVQSNPSRGRLLNGRPY